MGDRGSGPAGKAVHRFAALDLLRGVAALCILVGHYSTLPPYDPAILGMSYLAVDLFFVLSGFVISHAYESRLSDRRQLRDFALARLIRLYPLYLFATLISVALLGFASIAGRDYAYPLQDIAASAVPALIMLPTPATWSVRPDGLFPLVFTAWSLLWEVIVNALYGALATRLSSLMLLVIIAASGAGLLGALAIYGKFDVGWNWETGWAAAPRAFFSFFVGVALLRLRKLRRAPSVPAWLLALVLVAAVAPKDPGPLYSALCVLVLFPALVWLGADASQSLPTARIGAFLGFLSYPIYLLQAPLAFAVVPAAIRLRQVLPPQVPVELLVYFVGIIAVAWLMARYLDEPLRASLRRRLIPNAPRPQAETAP